MHSPLTIPLSTDRAETFRALFPQVEALLAGESDPIAAMANFCAAIHEALGWHWVGFYRVMNDELVLGPFQGPIACSRIAYGKGVCGTSWEQGKTLVVPDVEAFPGHIACSPLSRSEVVVPVRDRNGNVRAVLDIDSASQDDFTEEDVRSLEQLVMLLEAVF